MINVRRKKLVVLAALLIVSTLFVATAWATLALIQPPEAAFEQREGQLSAIPAVHPAESRSRAPEPATIALFGTTGIFGFLVRLVRKSYRTFKRGCDVALSVVALIILSPLCLIVAALVKLTSRGPVFYTQTRVGKDGGLFKIFKFRTMRVDAEKGTGAVWAAANDNRLIPAGKFIRKAHLDEIPQFVNVLRGEMSIIGPRPERPEFVSQFKEQMTDYPKRVGVMPGITGLAQVWHKYDESIKDVKKKLKYDLLYIRKICLWTDVLIMLRTVRVVFTGEGAR